MSLQAPKEWSNLI